MGSKSPEDDQGPQPGGADTWSSSLFVKGMKEQVNFYDGVYHSQYDKDMVIMQYGAPQALANLITRHIGDTNAKILDVVAGTGILGEILKKEGYTNVEGHDGSEKMLEIAKQKNIYKAYHIELLHPNQRLTLPEGSYDAAVATAIFAPGHLDTRHIRPIKNLVKKGGYVCFGINDKWVKNSSNWIKTKADRFEWDYDIEATCQEMENNGEWKLVERLCQDGYFEGMPGRYYAFQVL